MIVADSDILIDALRGRADAVEWVDGALASASLATTSVTAFELRSGAHTPAVSEKIDTLLAALQVLPLDERAAERAAEVRQALEKKGTPIGMADYLIAGICLTRSRALLTRNRSHFQRVPGLELAE